MLLLLPNICTSSIFYRRKVERVAKVKEAEAAAEVVEVLGVVEVAEVREVAEKKTNQKLNQNTTRKRKIQFRYNKHFYTSRALP